MQDPHDSLVSLSRTLGRYAVVGIIVSVVLWAASTFTMINTWVTGRTIMIWVNYIWQFLLAAAPTVTGVLVAVWIVGRLWIRSMRSTITESDEHGV